MRRTTTAVVTAVLIATTVAATGGTATAAPAHHAFAVAGGRVVLDDASSVAGYGADLSHYTAPSQWTATATFVVPTVRCTKATTNVLFIELFFNGTDARGNGLGEGGYAIASCDGTTPSYALNVSASGAANGGVYVPTAAGDSVTVSFAASRTSEVSTITDTTTGATGSQTGTGFHAVGGMQVSVQGGDAHSVFPKFNRIHFTSVLGARQPLQALNPGSFDAVDGAGNIKIHTDPIDTNGRGFFAEFVANFSPDA